MHVVILTPVLLGAIAAWTSVLSLHEIWTNSDRETYLHGYLIAALAMYILWRRRLDTLHNVSKPDAIAAALVLGVAACWLIFALASVQTLELALVPVLLVLVIGATLGRRAAIKNAMPLAFLYFAIPVWDPVNPLLQWLTVYAVRAVLSVAGIPAYFEGNQVVLPEGTFVVASGCSGLHFFITSLALATVVGEMRQDDWLGRLKVLLLAAVLSILANWIRVLAIIVAGHMTHMRAYIVAESHAEFGWLVFAVAMLCFLFLERRIPIRRAVPVQPVQEQLGEGVLLRNVIAVALLFSLPVATICGLAKRPAAITFGKLVTSENWRVEQPSGPTWRPTFVGADFSAVSRFRRDGGELVEAYLGLYRAITQGKELSGEKNSPYGDLQLRSRIARTGDGTDGLWMAEDPRSVMWVVSLAYVVDGRKYDDPIYAQVAHAVKSIRDLRAPSAWVVATRTPCAESCEGAVKRLRRFANGYTVQELPL